MSWVAPTSPMSGLVAFGHPDVSAPKGNRRNRKARLRRTAHEGRMNKMDEMLDTLQKSVAEISAAPEEGRAELLAKTFTEFREALDDEPADVRDALVGLAAEQDEALVKNMGHVAEFAGLLRSIELMLDRLAAEAQGKSGFSYAVGAEYGSEDAEVRKAHAATLHEVLDGWYGLGVRLLEVVVAAEAQNELADLGADDIEQINADLARVKAAIGIEDLSPEDMADEDAAKFDGGRLAKAFPPRRGEEEEEAEAPPEGEEPPAEDDVEVDEEEPLDPLDTLQRLLAAAMVTVDAIQGARGDGAPDEGEEDVGDEEAEPGPDDGEANPNAPPGGDEEEPAQRVRRAEKAVASGMLARRKIDAVSRDVEQLGALRKAEEASRLAAQEAEARLAVVEAELRKLQSMPAAPKGVIGPAALSKRDDAADPAVESERDQAERLAKMSPEQRTRELIKLSQQRPIRV